MSIPISLHHIVAVFKGDEEKRKVLVQNLTYNLKHGAYTTFGCDCDVCQSVDVEELSQFWEEIHKEAMKMVKENK